MGIFWQVTGDVGSMRSRKLDIANLMSMSGPPVGGPTSHQKFASGGWRGQRPPLHCSLLRVGRLERRTARLRANRDRGCLPYGPGHNSVVNPRRRKRR